MRQLLTILAKIISVMLHPILMPTYGIILYLIGLYVQNPEMPLLYVVIILAVTIFLSCAVPVFALLLLRLFGSIDSLEMRNRKQRTAPYIFTLLCFGAWIYFLHALLEIPTFLLVICIGALVALFMVTIINIWWKISAHLTGLGGLLGGICSFALYAHYIPMALIMLVLVMALLLMYARLYLNAHSPLQVVAGFLLGLISVFGLTCIIYYA
jgi:membrane-associated phospholipid phosphatase